MSRSGCCEGDGLHPDRLVAQGVRHTGFTTFVSGTVLMKLWPLLLLALSPAALLAAESPPNPGTAFITGSDRGIGFALVQEFESRGWQVIATARDPAVEGQRLDKLDQDEFVRVLRVNSYGPLRISA